MALNAPPGSASAPPPPLTGSSVQPAPSVVLYTLWRPTPSHPALGRSVRHLLMSGAAVRRRCPLSSQGHQSGRRGRAGVQTAGPWELGGVTSSRLGGGGGGEEVSLCRHVM